MDRAKPIEATGPANGQGRHLTNPPRFLPAVASRSPLEVSKRRAAPGVYDPQVQTEARRNEVQEER